MNTVKDLHPAIGQVVGMRLESLVVPVIIRDIKQSYGQIRFLVTPELGAGEQWCEITRFTSMHYNPIPALRGER